MMRLFGKSVFDAPEVGGFGAAVGEETEEDDEVCEGEESQGYPEVEEEVVVEREAVGAGVGGEEPRGEQERGGGTGGGRDAGEKNVLRISRSICRVTCGAV